MSAEEFYRAGAADFNQEKYKDARDAFSNALAEDKLHLDSLYFRAICHYKLSHFEKAIADFDSFVAIMPSSAKIYADRGLALQMIGKTKEALQDFDKAVSLEPQNPYRYASRAFIKDRNKDLQGAIEDYQKAIALDPEDAISMNNLGLVEEKLGYKERAQERFNAADKLESQRMAAQGEKSESPNTKSYETFVANKNVKSAQAPVNPEVEIETIGAQKQKNTYLRVIREVLTTREGFREFAGFVADKLSKGEK